MSQDRSDTGSQDGAATPLTSYDQWLGANDKFLAGALARVRTDLQRLAEAAAEVDGGAIPADTVVEILPNPAARQRRRVAESERPFGTHLPEDRTPDHRTSDVRPGFNHSAAMEPPAKVRHGLFRRHWDPAAGPSGFTGGVGPSAGTVSSLPASGVSPTARQATDGTNLATDFRGDLSTDGGQDLPLNAMCRVLGLSGFERQVLLLCAAMELDTRTARLCARAQHDGARPFPSFGLALELFEDPVWDAMSPSRPLRLWQLLAIEEEPGAPLVNRRLSADERVVNYLKGLNHLDARLQPLLSELPARASGLAASQHDVSEAVSIAVRHAHAESGQILVQLLGRDQGSKELVAAHVAHGLGMAVFKADADALPTALPEMDTATRLWRRETLLSPVCLFLDATELDPAEPAAAVVRRWLGRGGGLVFLGVRDRWPRSGTLAFEVGKPTTAEQRQAWQDGLGAGALAARLAGQFDFSLATISGLLEQAGPGGDLPDQPGGSRDGGSGGSSDQRRLWEAALMRARPALDQLAQRIDAKATWSDLQLPAEEEALLRQIAGQVGARGAVYGDYGFGERMNRGMGISVLFAGESGTGKTMAAEVLANDLGLLLYRVDLSAVVSKYIGETEKNLRRLFDAAEDGGAVLFFDEADALFGKRSEVKDSHDRYANIEINYLLQRIESFRGLAVLATNRRDSLDQAFVRRLRFIVTFPFPAVAQRQAIWERVFPAATKVDGLDRERLARLNVTGGSIQNIALNAAFLAAANGGTVTMPLILSAARNEFRKLDKPLSEADFHWSESGVGGDGY